MQSSKYLQKFTKLVGKEHLFKLHGGRVLVEILPQEEIKSAGGLVLAAPKDFVRGSTADTSRGTVGVVLLVGAGYYDEDGNDVPLTVKQGELVLLNDFGLKTFSTLPGLTDYTANTVALIDESLIQMSWENEQQFNEYCQLLK